ncbi:hypothetical protein D9M72_368990 [compost metagenome]
MPGLDLVAEGGDCLRGGADPGDARTDDHGGELCVFGQEAVARVDGVGAALVRHFDELFHHEVGLGSGVAAQCVGLIRQAHVQGVAVRVGVDGHRGDAFVPGGSDDAHGDFTAVGDEDFAQPLGARQGGTCVAWGGGLLWTCGLLRIC